MKYFYKSLLYLFLLSFLSCQVKKSLSILYFTDAHEIAPVQDRHGNRGGIARLKARVDAIKKEREIFVIFGGDLAGGTLFGKVFQGKPMVEAFNQVPIDLANFGQHEFDFGIENITNLIQASHFQWFSSNFIQESGKTFLNLPSYFILDSGNYRVGFVGLTDALNTSLNTDAISQEDLITAAQKAVDELEEEQVDYIIAITQMEIKKNEELLDEIKEIDLVFTEEISESESIILYVGKRPIIATAGNMGSLAEVLLEKENDGFDVQLKIHPLDSTQSEDLTLLQLQNKYMEELESSLAEVLSYSKVAISDTGSRKHESLLGKFNQ